MKDILFRGQTRRHGEKVYMNGKKVPSNWVYGGVCQGKGDFSIIYGSMDIELEQPTEKRVVYTDTLGQYTGLVDKNGTKIFEGDIVIGNIRSQWSKRLIKCEIAYGRSGFEAREHLNGLDSDYYTHAVLFSKDVEVIGNIYDNPELLKREG
jgi:uncharacterized phage protein (TIGR01671 family)